MGEIALVVFYYSIIDFTVVQSTLVTLFDDIPLLPSILNYPVTFYDNMAFCIATDTNPCFVYLM